MLRVDVRVLDRHRLHELLLRLNLHVVAKKLAVVAQREALARLLVLRTRTLLEANTRIVVRLHFLEFAVRTLNFDRTQLAVEFVREERILDTSRSSVLNHNNKKIVEFII